MKSRYDSIVVSKCSIRPLLLPIFIKIRRRVILFESLALYIFIKIRRSLRRQPPSRRVFSELKENGDRFLVHVRDMYMTSIKRVAVHSTKCARKDSCFSSLAFLLDKTYPESPFNSQPPTPSASPKNRMSKPTHTNHFPSFSHRSHLKKTKMTKFLTFS